MRLRTGGRAGRAQRRLLLGAAAAVWLATCAAPAGADHGLGRPPLADAELALAPAALAAGTTSTVSLTFTLGSAPASITNGQVDFQLPADWTVSGASLDGASTCDTAHATTSFGGGTVGVSHISCTSGETLVVSVDAATPAASAESTDPVETTFKTRPGSRRRFDNVWRTTSTAVTLSPAAEAATDTMPTGGFVQRSGKQLLLDGEPYTFSGLNVYYANSRGRCGPSVDLGDTLDQWGGGKEVLRAWFFQNLATSDGERDWSAFDQTIAIAKERGYRIIATLANQWGDCDTGYGYKSEDWYRSGYKAKDPLGTVSYRDYVAEIVSRYRDDPTILAWQLVNEAEDKTGPHGGCPADAADVLQSWATDVSGLIKSLDPNHLVSLGTIGGGQCGTSSTEYRRVHDIPTIDLCEVHDVGHPDSTMPGDAWNGMQASLNFCNALNKPLFVGESGIAVESPDGLQARADEFAAKFKAQAAAGVVGELAWLWSPFDSIGYDIGPTDPALAALSGF
jgi:hypothetical protein